MKNTNGFLDLLEALRDNIDNNEGKYSDFDSYKHVAEIYGELEEYDSFGEFNGKLTEACKIMIDIIVKCDGYFLTKYIGIYDVLCYGIPLSR